MIKSPTKLRRTRTNGPSRTMVLYNLELTRAFQLPCRQVPSTNKHFDVQILCRVQLQLLQSCCKKPQADQLRKNFQLDFHLQAAVRNWFHPINFGGNVPKISREPEECRARTSCIDELIGRLRFGF